MTFQKKERIKIICGHCKQEFSVIQSRKDTAKYCRFECRVASQIGRPSLNKGKKLGPLSIEARQKISLIHKGKPKLYLRGKPLTPQHRKKLSESHKGREVTEETRARLSKSLRGHKVTEETRKKISEKHKGKHFSPRTELKIGNKLSEETKKKIGEKSKQMWENPEYKEKTIKAILKGLIKRPTSLEIQMINLIQKHSLPFKYTGNGQVIINYRNPDFIECNGRKLIIETANPYHHKRGVYEKDRAKIFAKYGYKTLVLWWDDFFVGKHETLREDYEDNVLNKIRKFIDEKES